MLGSEEFELAGTALSHLNWADSSLNELTLSISDPNAVGFDMRYSGTHSDGNSEESFEVLVCHVKQPS